MLSLDFRALIDEMSEKMGSTSGSRGVWEVGGGGGIYVAEAAG